MFFKLFMTTLFSTKYKEKQKSVEAIIKSFDHSGSMIGDRGRNIIKLFLLDGLEINVKSFKIPHFINKIAYRYFRDSKAKRSFTYAQKLLSLDILTPYPIAYFEEKSLLFLLRSFYLSEQQDYDLTYRDLIENPIYIGNEAILRAFTRFTHTLHEKGILFKDHSPGNTLIKITNEGYNFYLVDLNRMEFTNLDFNARIKNFSRLSPKKEMVRVMANEYSKLTGIDEANVFNTMWSFTEVFQKKYFRKIALKKKLFFWRTND